MIKSFCHGWCGPLIQTILLDCVARPNSYLTPGPLNLNEKFFLENGVGSLIGQSVVSILINPSLPSWLINRFFQQILREIKGLKRNWSDLNAFYQFISKYSPHLLTVLSTVEQLSKYVDAQFCCWPTIAMQACPLFHLTSKKSKPRKDDQSCSKHEDHWTYSKQRHRPREELQSALAIFSFLSCSGAFRQDLF